METHFAPGLHSKTPLGRLGWNIFILKMCQISFAWSWKKNTKKFDPKNIMETHFAPGWHSKTPLGRLRWEIFQTQNVPDIIPMILEEKYKKLDPKNTKETHFAPWWHSKTPNGRLRWNFFKLKMRQIWISSIASWFWTKIFLNHQATLML